MKYYKYVSKIHLKSYMYINNELKYTHFHCKFSLIYVFSQYEVAWVITNLASGTTAQTMVLVNLHIIPQLMNLISCKDNRIVEQVITLILYPILLLLFH